MNRTQWPLIFGLTTFVGACGSEEETGMRRSPRPQTGNTRSLTCVEQLKVQDTDSDGLKDYNELYGFTDASGTIYFTDPEKADTDGDTYLDGEELSTTKIFKSSAILPSPISLHPLAKDYVIRIFARGGKEGIEHSVAEINASTVPIGDSREFTGWNYFTQLHFPAGKNILLRDLRQSLQNAQLGGWSTTGGFTTGAPPTDPVSGHPGSTLSLPGLPANYCDHRCLANQARGLLIAKFTAHMNDAGSLVFSVGDQLTAVNEFSIRLTIPENQNFLLLRANDRDHNGSSDSSNPNGQAALSDNIGFQTLLIRLETDEGEIQNLRPQRVPTASEFAELSLRLCTD